MLSPSDRYATHTSRHPRAGAVAAERSNWGYARCCGNWQLNASLFLAGSAISAKEDSVSDSIKFIGVTLDCPASEPCRLIRRDHRRPEPAGHSFCLSLQAEAGQLDLGANVGRAGRS